MGNWSSGGHLAVFLAAKKETNKFGDAKYITSKVFNVAGVLIEFLLVIESRHFIVDYLLATSQVSSSTARQTPLKFD